MALARWQPRIRRIPVTTPAAGADWTRVNDSGGYWLVRGLAARLVTDANVANRDVAIRATAGTEEWFRTGTDATQAASLTRNHSAFPGAVGNTLASTTRIVTWPTEGLLLSPGDVLASETTLIQATDQWSLIILGVIEYPATLPEYFVPFPYAAVMAES